MSSYFHPVMTSATVRRQGWRLGTEDWEQSRHTAEDEYLSKDARMLGEERDKQSKTEK